MRYNIDNYRPVKFANKLERLIDYRYADIQKRERRKKFVEDYDDKYPSEKGAGLDLSLKQWMTYNSVPKIERLLNICELLECDIDYFLTDQKEFKKEIASAAEVTGLSYEAVERVKRRNEKKDYFNRMKIQVLDKILSSDENYDMILDYLSLLVFGIDPEETDVLRELYDCQVEQQPEDDDDENHLQYFTDTIADTDFYYFYEYNKKIYVPLDGGEYGSFGFQLFQNLADLRAEEKAGRKVYQGDITLMVEWKNIFPEEIDYASLTDEEYDEEMEKEDVKREAERAHIAEKVTALQQKGICIKVKKQ